MLASRRWALTWTVLRIAMAAGMAAAIIAQLVKSLATAAELGKDVGMTAANFFSFFTILSNALTAVVLVWAAVWFLARGRVADAAHSARATAREPAGLAVALACVTTYMVITGIVYNTLLRFIVLPQGSEPIPWSNETLHLIGPLFLLADLFVGPARRALAWRAIWAIIAFPLVWAAYTLIRGPLVTDPGGSPPYWYPYPFMNPNDFDNGYAGVSVYIVGIAVTIIGFALLVVWVGRRRAGSPESVTSADVGAGA